MSFPTSIPSHSAKGGSPPRLLAVGIATFRREKELRRLLENLSRQSRMPDLVLVADNAADPATRDLLAEAWEFECRWLPLPDNPGCGAGLKVIEETLLEETEGLRGTLVVLDDDAVPENNFIAEIEEVLENNDLDLAAPLITDEEGHIWAPPEPVDPAGRKAIRNCRKPVDAVKIFGQNPQPLCWCAGTAFAVKVDALRKYGCHKSEFWLLGEDLEFSMRMAAKGQAAFFSGIEVGHFPPPPAWKSAHEQRMGEMRKFSALLQNVCYLSFHGDHAFHLRRYVPGNLRRWFRTFGFRCQSIFTAFKCFWLGAFCGEPAGGPGGRRLRDRLC